MTQTTRLTLATLLLFGTNLACDVSPGTAPSESALRLPAAPTERREVVLPQAEDPESFFEAYGAAFEIGDVAALTRLHAPDFSFDTSCGLGNCVEPLPWGREKELRALDHMMDPNFVGEFPPTTSRQFSWTIASTEDLGNGRTKVTATLEYRALFSDQDGFVVNPTVEIILRGRPGRSLQIESYFDNSINRLVESCWVEWKCAYLG